MNMERIFVERKKDVPIEKYAKFSNKPGKSAIAFNGISIV